MVDYPNMEFFRPPAIRTSMRRTGPKFSIGQMLYASAGVGGRRDVPVRVTEVVELDRTRWGYRAQYVYGECSVDNGQALRDTRLSEVEEQSPANSANGPRRLGSLSYYQPFGNTMIALYKAMGKIERASARDASKALRLTQTIKWSYEEVDTMMGVMAVVCRPQPLAPALQKKLLAKTNIAEKTDVTQEKEQCRLPWLVEIAVWSANRVRVSKQEQLDLEKSAGVWVVCGWDGHPAAIHVPEGVSAEDVAALREAFDWEGSRPIFWQKGCGASGPHNLLSAKLLMSNPVAKECFFGPNWREVKIVAIDFKPPNTSARVWYVERALRSYEYEYEYEYEYGSSN